MGSSVELIKATGEASVLATKERTAKGGLDSVMKLIRDKKADLYKLKEGVCYACGQDLPEDETRTQIIEDDLKLLFKKLDTARSKIDSLDTLRGAMSTRIDHLTKESEKESKAKEQIAKSQELIRLIDENQGQKENEKIQERIKEITEQSLDNKKKIADLEEEHKNVSRKFSIDNWLYRTFLARNGPVAARMNEVACNLLASELNSLAGDIGMYNAAVVTSGKSIEIEVSFRGNEPVRMSQMSGGERKINDILVMIALINIFSDRFGLD